jgi:hypothetical protein
MPEVLLIEGKAVRLVLKGTGRSGRSIKIFYRGELFR